MRRVIVITLVLLGGLSQISRAQELNTWLNRVSMQQVDSRLIKKDSAYHTTVKPYLRRHIDEPREILLNKDSEWYYRKLVKEHLIIIQEPGVTITADPIYHFSGGYDFSDADSSRIWQNSRGLMVEGQLGDRVGFYTSFLENQAFFPDYQTNYVQQTDNVPGLGRVKPFKVGGFDFAMASGYVSIKASENINVQFGHDKRFIGNGYRSLLLSDNAFNYPFLQVSTTLAKGKLRLNNLYSTLQSLQRLPYRSTPEALFERKTGSFHTLSWLPAKNLEIALFEGTIWQRMDTARATLNFNPAFVNPVPLVGVAMHGFDNSNNVVLGLNARYNIRKVAQVYGQVALDDPSTNRMGYQVGVHAFDLFTEDLNIQVEYNSTGNYTYSNSDSLQNYGHLNQPLAHPLGAGFSEIVLLADYTLNQFFGRLRTSYAQFNNDDGIFHLGSNILRSYDSRTISTVNTGVVNLMHVSLTLGYTFNKATNAQVFLNFAARQVERTGGVLENESMNLINVGLSTNLWNSYTDF